MAWACAWRKQSDKIWILKSQLQERYCRCTAGPCRISQGPKSDYLPSKQTMLLWTGLDLYEEMQKFYRDFYSANGMTLSVIGKESIPELEVPCAAFFSLHFSCLIWINELCRLWFERSFPPLWTRTWLCPKAGEKLMKKPLLNLYILWHLMRCPKVMQWVSIHPSSPRTGLVGLPQCSTNRNVDFRNGIACCCNRLWRMSRRGWDETQSNRFRKV